jgi:CheY-like chemotaxis protein
LVEDNPINLFMMQTLLGKFQCRVDTAETGSEALERLATEDYKVVLLDIQLPDIGGVEVCRRIRSGEDGIRHPAIPVIALTAHAMNGDREKFLDASMDDYLSKPINLTALIKTLKKDALANSICHPRMPLSGIHDFNILQTGFPLRISAGMTICECIKKHCKKGEDLSALNAQRP